MQTLLTWITENKMIAAILAVIPVFMGFMKLIETITGKKNIANIFWVWVGGIITAPFKMTSILKSMQKEMIAFRTQYEVDRAAFNDNLVRMEIIIMDIQETTIVSLDMLGVPYWISNEKGECIVASKALQKVMGRSEAEIKGNNWSTYVRNHSFNVMDRYLETIETHSIFDENYECIRDDKIIQFVNGFAKHKYDKKGIYRGSIGRLLPIEKL